MSPSRAHLQGGLAGIAVTIAIVGGALAARELRSSNAAQTRVAAGILPLINARRAKLHLVPLRADRVLASLARIHNQDERREGFYAHDNPRGQTFLERVAWLHRRVVGEVIAYGSGGWGTAKGIVALWFASPEHKRVLLEPAMRRIGISVIPGPFLGGPSVQLAAADLTS